MEISLNTTSLEFTARRYDDGPQILGREINIAMIKTLDVFEESVAVETPVGATGAARSSITKEIFGSPLSDDFTGKVLMTVNYGYYLENGRGSGRMPPVNPLELWVRRKLGISDGARSVAWAIAKSIARKGTRGARMFARGYARALPTVAGIWERLPDNFNRALRGGA